MFSKACLALSIRLGKFKVVKVEIVTSYNVRLTVCETILNRTTFVWKRIYLNINFIHSEHKKVACKGK